MFLRGLNWREEEVDGRFSDEFDVKDGVGLPSVKTEVDCASNPPESFGEGVQCGSNMTGDCLISARRAAIVVGKWFGRVSRAFRYSALRVMNAGEALLAGGGGGAPEEELVWGCFGEYVCGQPYSCSRVRTISSGDMNETPFRSRLA